VSLTSMHVTALAAVMASVVASGCRNGNAAQQRDTARARAGTQSQPQMGSLSGNAPAQSVAALPTGSAASQGSGEWWMPGRDFAASRYSALNDINVSNVVNMKVATTFSTGVLHGHEGQPLVVGSTMYVVTPYPNILYAIDLT
jgi:glucose dehydrogenase